MANITTIRGMELDLIAEDYDVICTGNGKTFQVDRTDRGFSSRFLVGGTRIFVELDEENNAKAQAVFDVVANNVAARAAEEKAYEDHYNAVIALMNP